jgi:uncharacterized membrane protein YcaP (DUF421 family)/predicted RNA-binding Zn-ribbon protein involved in translation (DUF1610 family)
VDAPIDLVDLQRWLAGSTPWPFLIEIGLRACFVYAVLILAMRLLGKRVTAQLTLFELSVVVTLAAAAGVVLEAPNRGLLPAAVVILAAVALQRAISRWGMRRRRVERIVSGRLVTLVEDGRLLLQPLGRETLSREKLFSELRGSGIQHLGEISRLYLEASGAFSLVRARTPRPGLSILPDADVRLRAEAETADASVCGACGLPAGDDGATARPCPACGQQRWTRAANVLGT